MNDIIINIHNYNYLESNINVYCHLSKQNKLNLLDNLKYQRTEIVGKFLNRIYTLEHDKQIQKTIKKLLFHLKTAGIKVEDFKVEGDTVLKKYEEKREHRGLMSSYDGHGTRMVMIAFETKRNAYALVHGLIHFSKGLLELGTVSVDRDGSKRIITQYLKGSTKPFTVVEVAPRYVHYLIEEASNISGRYVDEINQIKSLFSRLGGQIQKPIDIYTLPIPNDIEALSLERILSIDLFEPFFVTWNTLEEDKKKFNDIGSSSTIVLPPYLVEEKKQEFIKSLIESEKLSPNLSLIKRLMEDYAYIFHVQGEFKAYKGIIEILQRSDGSMKTLTFFVKKAIEEKKEQLPSLIVNPYEQIRPSR
jgi:hypothetical protein